MGQGTSKDQSQTKQIEPSSTQDEFVLSQFEDLPKAIHKRCLPHYLDTTTLFAIQNSSGTLYRLYQPATLKRTVEILLKHAAYATAEDIQKIKKILNAPLVGKQPNLNYLRQLLVTTATVKRYDGRILKDRTLYQIALAAREYNVSSENGTQVVDGLIEMLGEQYFIKLPDGTTLRKQQYDAQFPEGFEEKEGEKITNDSLELNRMINTVKEATDADCQQTLALDSFHGYDLRSSDEAANNNKVLASAIYLTSTERELVCRFRGLDGKVKTKNIAWDGLKEFPHAVTDILKDKNKYLPNILEQLAEAGQFYTAKQIEELKVLSEAVVTAGSPEDFESTWGKLQVAMEKMVGGFFTINFTVLEALYQYRNYLEPKEAYTTGYHSNPSLLDEAYQLYDTNYPLFGNRWYSPKNLLCAQKILGFVQRGLSACELQLHAQGLFAVLRKNEKSKRTFSFRDGDESILPCVSDFCFRLGYNYCGASQACAGLLKGFSAVTGASALEILHKAKTAAQQRLCLDLAGNQVTTEVRKNRKLKYD